MNNPFEIIDARLANIECLLIDLKRPVSQHILTPDYISRQDAADILGVSLHTLNAWTKDGKVPAYRIGSRVRYIRSEVESSLKKIKVA